MDCSPVGSSVHGIFQARILECAAISFSRGLPDPGIKPVSPELSGRFCTTEPPEKSKMRHIGRDKIKIFFFFQANWHIDFSQIHLFFMEYIPTYLV